MRCVIVGGATIKEYERVSSYLKKDDHFIFCDSGLKHLGHLEADGVPVTSDLTVGDFDSHVKPDTGEEVISLPVQKDDTDTFYAAKEAVKRGFDEFLLIGVIGDRFDHSLANISILLMLEDKGFKASLVDDHSYMEIVSDKTGPKFIEDKFSFFSLLNITGKARGIDITGAKYPLNDGEVKCEYQYAVSNEVLPGKVAEVSVKEGKLLLIKDF